MVDFVDGVNLWLHLSSEVPSSGEFKERPHTAGDQIRSSKGGAPINYLPTQEQQLTDALAPVTVHSLSPSLLPGSVVRDPREPFNCLELFLRPERMRRELLHEHIRS